MVEVLKKTIAVLEAEAEKSAMLAAVDPNDVSWDPSEEAKKAEAIEEVIQAIRHLLVVLGEVVEGEFPPLPDFPEEEEDPLAEWA